MSVDLTHAIRRLAHPRSRRSTLWACVYCGTFDRKAATESEDVATVPSAD